MKKFSKNLNSSNQPYNIIANSNISICNDEINSSIAQTVYSNNSPISKNYSNPFEQKSYYKNDIQKYFNDKYLKINSVIKDVILNLSAKDGSIYVLVKDLMIDSQLTVAKYFYNNDLKLNQNDERNYRITTENNISTIEISNDSDLIEIVFTPSSIIKIQHKSNNETITLFFKKQNLFEKLFSANKNKITKYEKRNQYNDIIESVNYSNNNKPEKYTKYRLNKKEYEIIFDSSDWQKFSSTSSINPIIPLEYIEYDFNQTAIKKLDFQYAKPYKYTEFNSNTGKIIKTFNLQGLYSTVVKYCYYNSITGQVVAFGKL